MADTWITTDYVILVNGNLTPDKLGLKKDAFGELQSLIHEFLLECQNLITDFCNTSFELPVPYTVQNVLLRLVSNMIGLCLMQRDKPINNVRDWKLSGFSTEIFTNDLKTDLLPYVESSHVKPSKDYYRVGALAITGDKHRRLYKWK